MVFRTGANAPLGMPPIEVAQDDDKGVALGTIIPIYDPDSSAAGEAQWVLTGADHTAGEDVDISASNVTSDAAAGTGAADAIVASTSGQYVWVLLKPRQPIS